MTKRSLCLFALAAAVFLAPTLPAQAQGTAATPRQIQTMIDNGEDAGAIQLLRGVLQQHPGSGTAWYLMAEAQDARGDESAAAQALARADQYAPGLPFANPQKAAALRAHINAAYSSPTRTTEHRDGIGPVPLIIGGLILLFLVLRLFSGIRRPQMAYRPYYPRNPSTSYGNYPPSGPYGPGGYGPMGGGFGSSIVSGLAAGAGFAAGERIVDDMMGGWDAQAASPQQDFGSSCDDGLLGNPGWDNNDNIDDGLNSSGW